MALNTQQSRIEITAVDKTKDAFDSVKRGFDGIASQYLGLTTVLSTGGFALMIKQTIDAADAIHDLSTRTGISVEQLGSWALATEQSGTSMEALAKALGKASKYMVEHSSNLKAIGITGKTAEEVMLQLAGVISKLPSDDPRRVALAMEVLGKSAGELVPLLSEGEAGLRKMLDRGRELNPVTTELANNADKFKDNLAELKLISSGLFVNLVSNTLPSLIVFIKDLRDVFETGDWVDKLLFFVTGTPGKIADKNHDPIEQIKRYEDAIKSLKSQMDQFPNSGTLQSRFKPEMERLQLGLANQQARLLVSDNTSPTPVVGDAEKARLQKQIDDLLNKDTKVSDYTKLTQAINEKIAASQRELAIGQPLSDSEKLLSKIYADRASGAIDITDKEQRLLEVSLKRLGGLDKQNDQEKEVQKAMAASADEYDKQLAAIQQNIDQTQVQSETYGKSASAITEVTLARLESKKAMLEEIGVWGEAIDRLNGLIDANNKLAQSQKDLESKDILANYAKGRETYFEGLDSEILKLKEQNDLYGLTETQLAAVNVQRAIETKLKYEAAGGTDAAYLYDLQREIDLRKQMLDQTGTLEQKKQWTDIFSSIDKTAHDTFVSIFDSGKSAFDRLRDALKNGLLDLLYQMTIKKWIFQISAAVTGTGAAGSALASTSASGSGFDSLLSGGKLLDGIQNGFGSLQAGLQSSIEHLGAFLSTGNGGLGDVIGGALGQYSSQIANVLPYAGAAFSLLTGDVKGAAIQGVATAIGSFTPLGPIGGAVIGSILSSVIGGGGGHKETHAYANTSISDSGVANIGSFISKGRGGGAGGYDLGISSGLSIGNTVEALASALGGKLTQAFTVGTGFLSKYNAYAVTVGRPIASYRNSDFSFAANDSSNGAAFTFFSAIRKGFIDLDPYLKNIINRSNIVLSNSAAAVTALSTIQNLYKSLQDLPPVFKSIGDAIRDSVTTDSAATLQSRFNAINTFTGLFYSDQEKLATFTKQLNTEYKSLNITIPATRDDFRKLVDGIDTTSASGLGLFNTLIDLAPTMDAYYKALEQQAGVTDQAAAAAKQLSDALSTDGFSTLVDYTRAQKYILNGIPGYASGGDFTGGIRIVGENGPELEATGPSRITNTNDLLNRLRNPQAGNAALVDEVRALRAEIAQMRAEQFAASMAVANNTAATNSTIKRWDGDGMPPARS